MKHKRGFYLTIGVLNILAATLMSVAIGTNKWAEASVVRNIAIPNGNLTRDASFTAGFKYIGMFRGCEEKKYGSYFEPRSRCFNALEEYGEIAKAELAYAALISCCLCICLQVIITYILLYDELVRSASKRMQCTIPTVTMSFIGMTFNSFSTFLLKLVHCLLYSLFLPENFSQFNMLSCIYESCIHS